MWNYLLFLAFLTPLFGCISGLKAQVLDMGQQLRENEVILRSAKSTEDCALLKLQQVEFERDSLKSHHDNSKALVKSLESEHKSLDALYHEIESTLKEKIEENVMLNLELDSYDQKVSIIGRLDLTCHDICCICLLYLSVVSILVAIVKVALLTH